MPRIEPPHRPPWWIRLVLFLARKMYGKALLPLQMAAHADS
jgi:hypothetical protein